MPDVEVQRQSQIDWAWYAHTRDLGRQGRPTGWRKQNRVRNPKLTIALKVRMAGEQGWRCCCCGHRMGLGKEVLESRNTVRLATFEHLKRAADRGSDDEANLAISCLECNNNMLVQQMFGHMLDELLAV